MAKSSIAAVWVGGLLAAGCATSPLPPSEATHVPSDRQFELPPVVGLSARVTIVRDSGMYGAGCYLAVYVNHSLLARMNPGEVVSAAVPVGELLLGLKVDPQGKGVCALGIAQGVVRESVIKSGETKSFRIASGYERGFDIIRFD